MPRYRFEVQIEPGRVVVCEPATREEAEELFHRVVPDIRRTPGTWARVEEDGELIYACTHNPRPERLSLAQMREFLRGGEGDE